MIEINSVEIENLIDENMLNIYYRNIEKIKILKDKERSIMKEIEEKNHQNKQELNELEKENNNIERMIQNILLSTDRSRLVVHDSNIILNKESKVNARVNKKDKLIDYINENDLPIKTWVKADYNRDDLIRYLSSKEYNDSYHSITKEIESYVTVKENISISIKKINRK